ncbi:MAG: hypothetical protein RSC36_04805, partial [Ruthenibacterium sp.]
MKTKEYSAGDVKFVIAYAKPAAIRDKRECCRAKINVIDEKTGKTLTKRDLYGSDSDYPVDRTVYGKSPQDIYHNKLPQVAASILAQMKERGLLPCAELA